MSNLSLPVIGQVIFVRCSLATASSGKTKAGMARAAKATAHMTLEFRAEQERGEIPHKNRQGESEKGFNSSLTMTSMKTVTAREVLPGLRPAA